MGKRGQSYSYVQDNNNPASQKLNNALTYRPQIANSNRIQSGAPDNGNYSQKKMNGNQVGLRVSGGNFIDYSKQSKTYRGPQSATTAINSVGTKAGSSFLQSRKMNDMDQISPELAAQIVKNYILPMFESDEKK